MYLLLKNHKLDLRRNVWLLVYVLGLVTISLLGSTNYVLDNFLPIGPQGIINTPYDALVVTVFSALIFVWAYFSNVNTAKVSDEVATGRAIGV